MKWLYEHWIITTLVVVVFLVLICAVTVKVFFDPVDVPNGTAAAFATFFGLPALVIGLVKWRSGKQGSQD